MKAKKMNLNDVKNQCTLNIDENTPKSVLIVQTRQYSGDGINLQTNWQNRGICTTLNKALKIASEYIDGYRMTVFITSIELNKDTEF